MRKIRFFSYYGSKNRIAPKYPFPVHGKIIEPFAGSAGYSCLYAERDVDLYDLDENVCMAWEYLIGVSSDELLSLPLIVPGTTVDDYCLTEEQRCLIGFWLNSATTRPSKSPSAWQRKVYPNVPAWGWGERRRFMLSKDVDNIRHWRVFNESYFDCPDENVTWFIDPPYCDAGRYYRHKTIDYDELAKWCMSRSGQVIVCENSGAKWLPFEVLCETSGTANVDGKSKPSKEVIYTK